MAKAAKHKATSNADDEIVNRIHFVRGQKVMLDYDLAVLYEVETRALNQAVKRNTNRFPHDFMFQLTREEYISLRSQSVTLEGKGRHSKYNPYAFTEQGVAMLSGVLTSERAIAMNIAIMRAFVETRKLVSYQKEISEQTEQLKERLGEHDAQLNSIYEAIENLLDDKVEKQTWENRRRIGFKVEE